MHALKISFNGNPNIGLYCFATDAYCLMPIHLSSKIVAKIKQVLGVPVYQVSIAGTDLLGALCTGSSDLLLVPEIIRDEEIKQLEKHKIPYKIIKTKLNALGNNMIIKGDTCLVNPEFDQETIDQLKKLNLKVFKGEIAESPTVGSCVVITSKGCIIHRDASEKEIEHIEKLFKTTSDIGTVNMGNPHVSSGIIANSNGYIIGDLTSGHEIMRIESALGFQNG